jgi:RNA polymerase sigma-70 factor, ECF subfamily
MYMEQVGTLSWTAEALESNLLENVGLRRLVLELYDAEHVGLRKYLTCLGIDRETGRELLQEVFLRLHEHLSNSGEQSNLRAWLYRVAHNLARNSQSAHRSSRTDYLPDVLERTDVPAKDATAEQQLLELERQRRLRQSFSELSERERESLVLRSQGMKYREIATVLNCSVSTVNENVQRAVERLRLQLGKEA